MLKNVSEWTIEELLGELWWVTTAISDSKSGSELELLHESYILMRDEIIRRAGNAEV